MRRYWEMLSSFCWHKARAAGVSQHRLASIHPSLPTCPTPTLNHLVSCHVIGYGQAQRLPPSQQVHQIHPHPMDGLLWRAARTLRPRHSLPANRQRQRNHPSRPEQHHHTQSPPHPESSPSATTTKLGSCAPIGPPYVFVAFRPATPPP